MPLFNFKHLICALACLLFASTGFAQSYSLQRYDAENGLSETYVYTIIEDETGFLYAGTGAGLFRFNGQSFQKLTRKDGLAEDFTTFSFRDSRNRIWFGHFEGGLSMSEGKGFKSVLDSNMLASTVIGITEDKAGNIWIGTQRSGIVRIDKDLKATKFTEGITDYMLGALSITDDNRLLLGTDAGVLVCNTGGNTLKVEGKAGGIPPTRVQGMFKRPKKKNTFWVATEDEGLWELKMDGGEGTAIGFGEKEGFTWPNIACVFEEQDARVWTGASGNGFLTFDDHSAESRLKRIQPTLPSDTLGADIVKCIYQDRFGQVWFGTYGGGLLCLSEETFSTIHLRNATIQKSVTATLEDRAGNFWFATPSGLMYAPRYSPDHFNYTYTIGKPIALEATRVLTTREGLPSNEITALYEDKDYNIWIGTRQHGIAYLDPMREKITPVELTEWALSKSIHVIKQDKAGNIWIGTTDGVFRHNPQSGDNEYYSTRNGLAHNNITDIIEDKKGRIWFVTHTNRITILDGKEFQLLTVTQNGEVPNINCITEGKDGVMWLGSDGMGLYRFDGTNFKNYNESNGLLSNYIYHATPDRYGNIWLAHRKGLSRYIPSTGKFIPYSNKDVFKFEENQLSSAFIDRKGNIWYGSERGAIRYNWIPSRTANQAPHTFISSVEIPGFSGLAQDGLELPYDSYKIRLNFLGLTFLDQSAVRYEYKVSGFAEDWSDPSESPFVTLQGLPDGTFTFMVRACNSMGNCNEVPAKFSFTILPPFWKTWWFRILMVIVLGAAIYGFVRYRTYRLNLEKQVLERKINERTRELKAEKEKVEQANHELEKLSLVASNTDNAVFILDHEGNLEWINDGFTRLTGYTLEAMYAFLPSKNLLATSTNKEIPQLLKRAIEGRMSVQYESQLPTTSGEFVWVLSTLSTVHDDKGNLRNIIIIDSNISERKKAEEAVRLLNTELEALVAARTEQLRLENVEHIKTAERLKVINQELDTFVYRASHDLKGPLASLLGLISIAISELEDNASAIKYLTLMERSGKRLDTILVDLIEATQIKQSAVTYTKVEVLALVQSIIAGLKNLPDFAKVKFELRIDPALVVVTDLKLFTAIMMNYINNTVKYSDKKKSEAVSIIEVKEEGGQLLISVSDNGLGIDPKLQSRVFDMFFRGTTHGGGSGLGLYIVAQAAEKLGGKVDMRSTEGEGSTFTASLPLEAKAD